MTLKDYMDKYGVSAMQMAKELDKSLSAIRKYRQGTRVPKLRTIQRISKITHGKVSFNDWD